MSPATIYLILSLVEEAIKDTPGIVADLSALFRDKQPTAADWEALRAKVLSTSYANYVPDSALASDAAAKPQGTIQEVQKPETLAMAGVEKTDQTPAGTVATDSEVKPAPQVQQTPAAADVPPYLPDGSKNPAFDHANAAA